MLLSLFFGEVFVLVMNIVVKNFIFMLLILDVVFLRINRKVFLDVLLN